MFDEFIRKAEELRTADEPFAIAVVVRSEPPVSTSPDEISDPEKLDRMLNTCAPATKEP